MEIIDWNNCHTPEQLESISTTKNDLGVDREDAVERLNALKQFIGYDKDSEIVKATQKSLDMAISALEHPERNVVAIVPCGDTISRQAVIDLMMQKWGENFSGDDAMQESIDAIRVMPSVTPQEPRKGHWIYKEYDEETGMKGVHYCSECGYPLISPYISFCSVCGYPLISPYISFCSVCGYPLISPYISFCSVCGYPLISPYISFCSVCGYPLISPYISFCSVCGADMREVEE